MAIEKVLLLIADIGGYTRFMKEHRFSLAHAQDTIAQLGFKEPCQDFGNLEIVDGPETPQA